MKETLILEFSELWLKAVVVECQGPAVTVKGMFLEPVEPDTVNFAAAINKILAQTGKKKWTDVTVAVGRNKVTVRRIDLPSRDLAEINQILGLHVVRHVPYPKEDILWAYYNLGFDGISTTRILLAIAHRDVLRNISNSLKETGLQPENIFLSSPGSVEFVRDAVKDKSLFQQPFLILDIDNTSSELMLVTKQLLSSSLTIATGAEQLCSESGRTRFLVEMKQALSAFRDELTANRSMRVFITGAGETGPVGAAIEKEFGLKILPVAHPEFKAALPPGKDVSFVPLLGFCRSHRKDDIVFILPEIQVRKEMQQKIRQMLIMGVGILYIFIMTGLMAFSYLNQRQTSLKKLNAAIGLMKSRSERLIDISRQVEAAKPYMDIRDTALHAIREFTLLCPETVVLTNFSWEKKKGLVVRGYAAEMSDIFSFVNTLDSSALFKGMKTRSTRRHKVKDKEVVSFEIGAQ